jgi:hypothetical protein
VLGRAAPASHWLSIRLGAMYTCGFLRSAAFVGFIEKREKVSPVPVWTVVSEACSPW